MVTRTGPLPGGILLGATGIAVTELIEEATTVLTDGDETVDGCWCCDCWGGLSGTKAFD